MPKVGPGPALHLTHLTHEPDRDMLAMREDVFAVRWTAMNTLGIVMVETDLNTFIAHCDVIKTG